MSSPRSQLPALLSGRRGHPQRWVVAGAAAVAGAAHVPVIGPHLAEAPYMGALFVALTTACLVIAAAITIRDTVVLYAAAVLTCGRTRLTEFETS
jgi:hypothetical protein